MITDDQAKGKEGAIRYSKLSSEDKALVDGAVQFNLDRQAAERGFGADPQMAAKNRASFLINQRAYFTEPVNLQRLRDNEKQRQANLAQSRGSHADRVAKERKDKGPPQVGG